MTKRSNQIFKFKKLNAANSFFTVFKVPPLEKEVKMKNSLGKGGSLIKIQKSPSGKEIVIKLTVSFISTEFIVAPVSTVRDPLQLWQENVMPGNARASGHSLLATQLSAHQSGTPVTCRARRSVARKAPPPHMACIVLCDRTHPSNKFGFPAAVGTCTGAA